MANINFIGKHLITYEVNEHYHNYWEIIYVTQGSGHLITADGTALDYAVNDILIIPPNLMHKNSSSSGFENIHLTIDNWLPPINNAKLIKDNSELDMLVVMKQAHRYFHISELKTRNKILLSLAELIIAYIETLSENPARSMITQIIENEIISNFTNPFFDIETTYSKIPYSKEYARKYFIKECGISPVQFLTKKRLELAAKMLATRKGTDATVAEISDKCGFSDQLYFSRIFKKMMGVPPKNYELESLDNNKKY